MGKIDDRLTELGLKLPTAPKPVAAYVPSVLHGGLLYISGQLPMVDGQLSCTGQVGQDVSLEAAQAAARTCTLNALAIAKDALGDLDRITRVVKVGGFVSSTPAFTDQPKVINGGFQDQQALEEHRAKLPEWLRMKETEKTQLRVVEKPKAVEKPVAEKKVAAKRVAQPHPKGPANGKSAVAKAPAAKKVVAPKGKSAGKRKAA